MHGAHRRRWLRAHVVFALAGALIVSGLLLSVTPRPAGADWPPCTTSLSGEGNCVPINGGVSDPATLSGPSSISVSTGNCPKGSYAAENGYSCSTPVTFELAIPNDSPTVYNIHFNGPSSETNTNIQYRWVPATTVPNDYTGWCEIDPTTAGCKDGNTKSLPLYLMAIRPIKHDTALTCVLGQYQGGDSFGDCIQIAITATTGKTKTEKMTISLAGKRGSAPNTIAVTMTLSNTGSSKISGLSFIGPTGLENDGVLLSNGNIGPTQSGLTLSDGPTPELPTTLPANGPPVVIDYTYTATSSGDAVLVADATGTNADGDTVTKKAALTVYVTNPPVSEQNYDQLVTSALLADDSIVSQYQNTIANTEATSLASGLKLPTASPGQQAAAVQLGLPTQMGVLVGSTKTNAMSQWFDNYSSTLASDLKGGASYLGKTGEALATQLLQTATDPEARAAALGVCGMACRHSRPKPRRPWHLRRQTSGTWARHSRPP